VFSGQLHTDTVLNIPYSFGPDSFVEPGINVHIWSSHLHHGQFPDLSTCPRGLLFETHSIDALVNVDGIFSGHYLIGGRMALLATLLYGSHSARPWLERESARYCGVAFSTAILGVNQDHNFNLVLF